jgi:hypothetical protein
MKNIIYKFAKPENEEEAKQLFIMIEDRGDRAEFQNIRPMSEGSIFFLRYTYKMLDMIENG